MIDSMSARPPQRGVEVLTTRGDISGTDHLIEERTRQLQQCGVRDFAELRRRSATEQSDPGDHNHAVVVVVDGDRLMEEFVPVATREGRVTRAGSRRVIVRTGPLAAARSLPGRSHVLNVRQLSGPWLTSLSGLMSSVVEVDESGTAATWRNVGVRSAPVDVVLPMNNEGKQP